MRERTFLALLVLLSTAFAGCAGAAGETKANVNPPSSSIEGPGGLREDGASVAGLVLDDSELPIAYALVGILELTLQAATDASGSFKFTNLAPGTMTVSVAALGYQTTSKRLTLAANEDQQATFRLVPIPIDAPYHEVLPFDGFFSCKLGIQVQSTACGSVLVGVAVRTDDIVWANDKAFQWWNLTSPNWQSIIGELTWTQGTFATTTKLRSSFDHERFGSHWFCGQEGHNPIYYRYERNETGAQCQGNTASANAAPQVPIFGKPMVTGFRVPFGCAPASTAAACQGDPADNPPVYLAFQQRVRSHMSIFYGEPAPELWHAQEDA